MPCLEEKDKTAGKSLKFTTTKDNIVFIKDIFESYENLALLTTLNNDSALLQLTFHDSNEKIIKEILDDLEKKFSVNINLCV